MLTQDNRVLRCRVSVKDRDRECGFGFPLFGAVSASLLLTRPECGTRLRSHGATHGERLRCCTGLIVLDDAEETIEEADPDIIEID